MYLNGRIMTMAITCWTVVCITKYNYALCAAQWRWTIPRKKKKNDVHLVLIELCHIVSKSWKHVPFDFLCFSPRKKKQCHVGNKSSNQKRHELPDMFNHFFPIFPWKPFIFAWKTDKPYGISRGNPPFFPRWKPAADFRLKGGVREVNPRALTGTRVAAQHLEPWTWMRRENIG